ncbi:hypothetical protein D3C87_781750 [compost metagenome]
MIYPLDTFNYILKYLCNHDILICSLCCKDLYLKSKDHINYVYMIWIFMKHLRLRKCNINAIRYFLDIDNEAFLEEITKHRYQIRDPNIIPILYMYKRQEIIFMNSDLVIDRSISRYTSLNALLEYELDVHLNSIENGHVTIINDFIMKHKFICYTIHTKYISVSWYSIYKECIRFDPKSFLRVLDMFGSDKYLYKCIIKEMKNIVNINIVLLIEYLKCKMLEVQSKNPIMKFKKKFYITKILRKIMKIYTTSVSNRLSPRGTDRKFHSSYIEKYLYIIAHNSTHTKFPDEYNNVILYGVSRGHHDYILSSNSINYYSNTLNIMYNNEDLGLHLCYKSLSKDFGNLYCVDKYKYYFNCGFYNSDDLFEKYYDMIFDIDNELSINYLKSFSFDTDKLDYNFTVKCSIQRFIKIRCD